jgi:hypothetical protein
MDSGGVAGGGGSGGAVGIFDFRYFTLDDPLKRRFESIEGVVVLFGMKIEWGISGGKRPVARGARAVQEGP